MSATQFSVHFNLEMQYVINMGLVGQWYSIFKFFAKELLQIEKLFLSLIFLSAGGGYGGLSITLGDLGQCSKVSDKVNSCVYTSNSF